MEAKNRIDESMLLIPPTRIGVTQLPTAEACPLRFLLDHNIPESERALPSSSPGRYPGELFHGVVEDARRGVAGDPPCREALAECWRIRLDTIQASASDRGDGDWLPLTETCQSLESVRLRALNVGCAQPVRAKTGVGNASTEAWMRSSDGLVVGRVDAVDRDARSVVVRDFKSGEITDHKGALRPEYRIQVLAYACLHHESRSVWPDRLEIVDGRGLRMGVPVDQHEATAAVAACRDVLLGIQASAAGGVRLSDTRATELARPEGEGCRSCRHRPICPAYTQRVLSTGLVLLDDSRFPMVDSAGRVTRAEMDARGCNSVEVTHLSVRRTLRCPDIRRLDPRGGSVVLASPLTLDGVVMVFGASPKLPVAVDSTILRLVTTRRTRIYVVDETRP